MSVREALTVEVERVQQLQFSRPPADVCCFTLLTCIYDNITNSLHVTSVVKVQ